MDPLLRELEHNSLGSSVYATYAGTFAHVDDVRGSIPRKTKPSLRQNHLRHVLFPSYYLEVRTGY